LCGLSSPLSSFICLAVRNRLHRSAMVSPSASRTRGVRPASRSSFSLRYFSRAAVATAIIAPWSEVEQLAANLFGPQAVGVREEREVWIRFLRLAFASAFRLRAERGSARFCHWWCSLSALPRPGALTAPPGHLSPDTRRAGVIAGVVSR